MSVVGCLGCDLLAGRTPLPGGVLHETDHWAVNHSVGPLNLGTLVVSPKEHVVAVAELADGAVLELGPLLKLTASVVEEVWSPEQVYVCTWSHGPQQRRHLHLVVQPVTSELVDSFGGRRSEQLQAAVMLRGDAPSAEEVEAVCAEYRSLFNLG